MLNWTRHIVVHGYFLFHSKGHRVGEKVLAKWTDCKMYPAKITAILSDGENRLYYVEVQEYVLGLRGRL